MVYRVGCLVGCNVLWANLTLMRSRFTIRQEKNSKVIYGLDTDRYFKPLDYNETEWIKSRSQRYVMPDYEKDRLTKNGGKAYNLIRDVILWRRRPDLIVNKYRLFKSYESLANQFKLPGNFIYLPLHFQPERTTLPEAGIYADMRYAIMEILEKLQQDQFLVIKEHPSIFSNMAHWKYRWPGWYLKHRKILYAPIDFNQEILLNSACKVISINGSVSLEMMLRGKENIEILAQSYWKSILDKDCTKTRIKYNGQNISDVLEHSYFAEDVSNQGVYTSFYKIVLNEYYNNSGTRR